MKEEQLFHNVEGVGHFKQQFKAIDQKHIDAKNKTFEEKFDKTNAPNFNEDKPQ